MKPSGGKPRVIFDPVAGRFAPLPKQPEPAPRTFLVALCGWAGCIFFGAIAGLFSGSVAGPFIGAGLGFVGGIVLILLASLIRRALQRSP
jgi:hypothetical protein